MAWEGRGWGEFNTLNFFPPLWEKVDPMFWLHTMHKYFRNCFPISYFFCFFFNVYRFFSLIHNNRCCNEVLTSWRETDSFDVTILILSGKPQGISKTTYFKENGYLCKWGNPVNNVSVCPVKRGLHCKSRICSLGRTASWEQFSLIF